MSGTRPSSALLRLEQLAAEQERRGQAAADEEFSVEFLNAARGLPMIDADGAARSRRPKWSTP